jgi:hypothetical protein
MRIFNRIIIIINTLLFIVLGCLGIALSVSNTSHEWASEIANEAFNALKNSPASKIVVLAFSLFFLLTALLTIFGNLERKLSERSVLLESPMGEIRVSLSAIEDFSRVVKNQVEGVKEISGRVVHSRKGLSVTAKVVLYSDRSVADVSQEIQDSIIRYIQYTLGIETPVKPKVIVSKVVYKKDE